jgi:hypothetical protein
MDTTERLTLDQIAVVLADNGIDGPDLPYNPQALAAMRAADQMLAALHQVAAVCDTAEHQAIRWHDPLDVPDWVRQVRNAAGLTSGQVVPPPVAEWAVKHPGIGGVGYVDEAAARTAAGTAGTVMRRIDNGEWVEANGPDAVTAYTTDARVTDPPS